VYNIKLGNGELKLIQYNSVFDKHKIYWKNISNDGFTNDFKNGIFFLKAFGFVNKSWAGYDIYEIIDWANNNCLENFGFTINNVWYFESENDMLLFKLRWE